MSTKTSSRPGEAEVHLLRGELDAVVVDGSDCQNTIASTTLATQKKQSFRLETPILSPLASAKAAQPHTVFTITR
jgi:hypothetical protein